MPDVLFLVTINQQEGSDYNRETLNVLSLPPGAQYRYRYRDRDIDEAVAAAANGAGKSIAEYIKGCTVWLILLDEQRQRLSKAHYFPLRRGTVEHVSHVGTRLYITFTCEQFALYPKLAKSDEPHSDDENFIKEIRESSLRSMNGVPYSAGHHALVLKGVPLHDAGDRAAADAWERAVETLRLLNHYTNVSFLYTRHICEGEKEIIPTDGTYVLSSGKTYQIEYQHNRGESTSPGPKLAVFHFSGHLVPQYAEITLNGHYDLSTLYFVVKKRFDSIPSHLSLRSNDNGVPVIDIPITIERTYDKYDLARLIPMILQVVVSLTIVVIAWSTEPELAVLGLISTLLAVIKPETFTPAGER